MRRVGKWLGGGLLVVALAGTGMLWNGQPLWAEDPPAPVTHESSAVFRKVVKKTLPAVVSIDAKATAPVAGRRDNGFRKELQENLERQFGGEIPEHLKRFFEGFDFRMPEMPAPQRGFGSGVIISADGVIVTNNHVVSNATEVTVRLLDGREFTTSNISRDPKTDLAVIKLDAKDAKNLPVAELGDSDKAEIGDWVLAMGAPFGLQGTVTAGIVSAKGRAPRELDVLYKDFLQTDAAINPGNSGGPIVDLDGKIVGINTAIRSNTGTFGGVGFAIPSNMVKEVVGELVEHGKVRRGYLGVRMTEVTGALARKLGVDSGVMVTELSEGETPAKKAGLEPTDVIVAVDDVKVDPKTLQALVTKTTPGKKLNMTVLRDGKKIHVPVTIEEQPDDFGVAMPVVRTAPEEAAKPATTKLEKLGVTVQKHPREEALLVTEVAPDGAAAEAGIRPGMMILAAENKKTASGEELEAAIKDVDLAKEGALLKVRTPDGSELLVVVKQ